MATSGLVPAIAGALVLFWPYSFSARAGLQHEKRLEELRSGAEETYFEERRSLEAYRPPRSELTWRLLGAILLVLGLLRLFEIM
jgi:hypothetical protein